MAENYSDGRKTVVPLHAELDRGALKAILAGVDKVGRFLKSRQSCPRRKYVWAALERVRPSIGGSEMGERPGRR